MVLDARGRGALITALLGARWGVAGRDLAHRNVLERLRDRVVHRSQIGKLKLDRAATRRALEEALRHLGERYRVLVRMGKAAVPPELEGEMDAVRKLEDKLHAQDREITALEEEGART